MKEIKLVRYENVVEHKSGHRLAPVIYYSGTAVYSNGVTQEFYMNENGYKQYLLKQELTQLGITPEILAKVEELIQLAYDEGREEGMDIMQAQLGGE